MKNILFSFLLLSAPVIAFAQAPSTYKYSGYVNDFAHAIDDGEEAKLMGELKALDATKGVQLAVVTVPTLDGLEPEMFAQELFTNWGIGHKRDNTGILYLICPAEHRQRIHTGYGVEGILPDIITERIQRDTEPKMSRVGNLSPALAARIRTIARIVTESNDLGFDSKTAASKDKARNTYAVNPNKSVPSEEKSSDGTLGNVLSGVVLLLLAIAGIFWLRKGYRQRKEARLSVEKVASLQLTIMNGYWAKAALASNDLKGNFDITPVQIQQLQELNAEVLGYTDAVKAVYADIEHLSTKEIVAANTKVALYIHNTKSMLGQYINLENDVTSIAIAMHLNFEFDSIREEVMRSTNYLRNAISLVNARYPVSVWDGFDYINYQDNIGSCFNKMDIIKGKCYDIMKRNLTVDTAKNVVALHQKFTAAKKEVENILSTINGKDKQVERAARRIEGSELSVAYATAKRNAEEQFVSLATKTRLAAAATSLVRFTNAKCPNSDVLKLEIQYDSLLTEFNLIKERAAFDVRKHHQDIADAARSLITTAAAVVAAAAAKEAVERRRKQNEDDEEHRRQSSSNSSSSYDSSSSSSSDSSFSFGGGDSGGGGSDNVW